MSEKHWFYRLATRPKLWRACAAMAVATSSRTRLSLYATTES